MAIITAKKTINFGRIIRKHIPKISRNYPTGKKKTSGTAWMNCEETIPRKIIK